MSLSFDLVGLSLNLLGAVLIVGAQSRLFSVINGWLRSLDLAIESWLAGPRSPIMGVMGWGKEMERAVPWLRRISTLGWISVATGFAAQIAGVLLK